MNEQEKTREKCARLLRKQFEFLNAKLDFVVVTLWFHKVSLVVFFLSVRRVQAEPDKNISHDIVFIVR